MTIVIPMWLLWFIYAVLGVIGLALVVAVFMFAWIGWQVVNGTTRF